MTGKVQGNGPGTAFTWLSDAGEKGTLLGTFKHQQQYYTSQGEVYDIPCLVVQRCTLSWEARGRREGASAN